MSMLKQKLGYMLEAAYKRRGTPARQSYSTARGLHIDLYIGADRQVHLLLWRNHVAPSTDEWRTVIKHWPWPLPTPYPQPAERRSERRYGLAAAWPLTPQMAGAAPTPEEQAS